MNRKPFLILGGLILLGLVLLLLFTPDAPSKNYYTNTQHD